MKSCLIVPSILSNSALGIVELESDSSRLCEIYAQSLTSKGRHMPWRTWFQKLRRDDWMRHLSGRTCSISRMASFEDWWILRLRESRVSRTVMPDFAKEERTSDSSLTTGCEDFSRCVREASSSRTSRDCSPAGCQMELFASDGRWRDWNAWDIGLRRAYSARRNAARLTYGSGSLFWPTPTANEDKDQNASFETLARLDKGGRILRRMATLAMSGDGQADRDASRSGGSRRERLNPAWVESLLGLPFSWTDCAFSATESSPKPQP